jgi:hypothetical protein
MKHLLYVVWMTVAVTCMSACKHVDEEPEVNSGYDTEIPLPKAEPMTAEDSAVVAAQQAEYDQNAK